MNIRLATIKDYNIVNELMLKLHMYHVESCPENFVKIDIFFTKKEYKKRLKNGYIYYLAEINRKTVGLIGLNTCNNDFVKIVFVSGLYVESNYRNQNIATKLMETAFEYFRKNCNSSDYCDCLNLNVASFNESAINFYKKMGFNFQSHNMGIKLK